MTTVTRTAIALALTIVTTNFALAAPRYHHQRVHPTTSPAAVLGGGFVIGMPIATSSEEEARFDHAKGYPSGY